MRGSYAWPTGGGWEAPLEDHNSLVRWRGEVCLRRAVCIAWRATSWRPLGGGRAAEDIRDRRLGVLARHAAVLECRSWPVPALRNAYFVSTGPAPSESCRSSQADSGIAGG